MIVVEAIRRNAATLSPKMDRVMLTVPATERERELIRARNVTTWKQSFLDLG